MSVGGMIIGLSTFIIIGILHPVVIKTEYYFGKKVWPVFMVLGIVSLFISFVVGTSTLSSIMGVLGFSLMWSVKELFEQEERVKKVGIRRTEIE